MKNAMIQTCRPAIHSKGGLLLAVVAGMLCSCHMGKKATALPKGKTTLATVDRDWLQYQLYRQPAEQANTKERQLNMNFSIRIVNRKNSASPLRRLCSGIDEYNTYYEYLLNRAKDDIYLSDGTALLYPVAYSFENNYDVFPFETINVGYRKEKRGRKKENLELVFIDRVFSHDTLVFKINPVK